MSLTSALLGLAAALMTAGAAPGPEPAPAPASDPLLGTGRGLDHILVWSRDIDSITSIIAVKLGFQVRPGGDFGDGIANRLIRFSDRTYLELLYFTRAQADLSGDALSAFNFTARGTGSNSFGILVSDPDSTSAHLRNRGWELVPEEPNVYDPDGDGPLPVTESLWRSVSFTAPPLSASDLFFIRYRFPAMTPTQLADSEAFARHPNGAVRLSAIWLLTPDAGAEAARLSRMGFAAPERISLPHLAASGFRFAAGAGRILVIQPEGAGAAADALADRGPRVYGVSIEVADLARAQRIVERGYGAPVQIYAGPMGEAFSAPTLNDLGLVMEFHAAHAD